MRPPVSAYWLGRVGYEAGLRLQQAVAGRLLESLTGGAQRPSGSNSVLLLEHPPVYTVGIRRQVYKSEDRAKLQSLGAEYHETDRGGLITFHGPGQLMVYPVLYLKDFGLGMRQYICCLERSIMKTCEAFGVTAAVNADTGVWVANNKIAAIGVHGRRFVTTHGAAVNCNVDLSWYNHIVACGLEGRGTTTLSQETATDISPEDIVQPLLEALGTQLGCDINLEPKDNFYSKYLVDNPS